MSYVVTTFGGGRFHDDPDCRALDLGRYLTGARYEPRVRTAVDAASAGFTACRVCVPPALALPATGRTFGHEPALEAGYYGPELVCARCHMAGLPMLSQSWPCMSAAVLGLVVTDADRWNAVYPVGTPVLAWPVLRTDEPLRTRTRTPAWRLGHGASVVAVDGAVGGIYLTHVEAQ